VAKFATAAMISKKQIFKGGLVIKVMLGLGENRPPT